MTAEKFMDDIQEYYGVDYRPGLHRDKIFTYLEGKSERYLDFLFDIVILNFSGQYRTLPDVAIYEKLSRDVYDEIDKYNLKLKQDLSRKALPEETGEIIPPEEARKKLAAITKMLRKPGFIKNIRVNVEKREVTTYM